ncbi:MAG: MBL fold metallo-hydrolase [Alphaproteobacteria bacterium]|nr:MBL fold metallo-hydrolase [Alphaproteobacteria bacterium]
MGQPLPVNRRFEPAYGSLVEISPLVRRVVAHNPNPFTFAGTGTYVVGRGSVAVIDPGPLDEAHIAALREGLKGETIGHLLITHTHADHSPAAAPLKAATGAKTYGYGPHGSGPHEGGADVRIEEGGDMDFRPDVTMRDGDQISGPGWTFECVFTPGHTSNHLCFALKEEQALFTGDHVMGWSTTVIGPPDGDMAAYFASLERLLKRDDRVYYPTHGAPIGGPHDALARKPQDFVRSLIAHRRDREAQILSALKAGEQAIPELVRRIYTDVDPKLHPAAALSVHAHLIQLAGEGRVTADGKASLSARYRLAS